MQKRVYYFLFFLLMSWFAYSQTQYNEFILKEAHAYTEAIEKHNFKEVVAHIYPNLIEKLGGKDSMYVKTSNKMVALKQEGLRYKNIEFGKLSKIIKAKADLWYGILPQKITQINSQGQIITDTFLFVISTNQGKHWFFIDEHLFTKHKHLMFEKEKMELELPKKNKRFIKNKGFTSFNKPN